MLHYSEPGLDRALIHAIESVIIDWTHQIRDVLKRDSAQPLLEGLNPSPFVEVEFWKNKAANLECIYEQVRVKNKRNEKTELILILRLTFDLKFHQK